MEANKSIKQWAEDDRPREKMLLKGADSLSDAELIGILLGTGTKTQSAVDLARVLLNRAENNLSILSRFSLAQLQEIKGIGMAKAVTLAAALELGRRRQQAGALERRAFNSSKDAADFLMPMLQDSEIERFCVLYLNNSNKLLAYEIVSEGTQRAALVDVRVIMKSCLRYMACKMIVAHNHPSGIMKASSADIKLTQKIRDGAQLFDIELLDHLIVANNTYLSLRDEGLM